MFLRRYTHHRWKATEGLVFFQEGCKNRSESCTSRKANDPSERAMLLHEPSKILDGTIKTPNHAVFMVAIAPGALVVAFFSRMVGVGSPGSRRVVEVYCIDLILSEVLG